MNSSERKNLLSSVVEYPTVSGFPGKKKSMGLSLLLGIFAPLPSSAFSGNNISILGAGVALGRDGGRRWCWPKPQKKWCNLGKMRGRREDWNKSSSVWLWRLVWLMALFAWLCVRMFPSCYPCAWRAKSTRGIEKLEEGYFARWKQFPKGDSILYLSHTARNPPLLALPSSPDNMAKKPKQMLYFFSLNRVATEL